MQYEADIVLFRDEGRSKAPWRSPLLGHIKFETTDIDGYSVKVFFDGQGTWKLGETKKCLVQFLHFDDFPGELRGASFHLFEGREIGTGNFRDYS